MSAISDFLWCLLSIFTDPCYLACMQQGWVTYPHGRVADGTRCTDGPDTFDVCIAGECRVCESIDNKFRRENFWKDLYNEKTLHLT